MRRKSTPLKIAFFSILLAGFIVIQYCWMLSLQKDRLEEFRMGMIRGVNDAVDIMPFTGSLFTLTDTAVASLLRRSFSSNGPGNIRFEFAIDSCDHHLATRGFHKKLTNNSNHLTLYYTYQPNVKNSTPATSFTVVVPFWKQIVWKKMAGVIAGSVLLTLMIMAIFYWTVILVERGQQQFYNNRTSALKNMMLQLETSLSTVSVAADALRDARVMHDTEKMSYYRQIINEESQRMNEQVKKFQQHLM